MLKAMLLLAILAALLAACAPAPPPPVARPKPDPAKESWYGETAGQLAALAREAEAAYARGRQDDAAALVQKGQPLIERLLSAPQPTLAAMEGISDLDQLYGRMLFGNGHYVWARDFFQKNVTRWSTWTPHTADTARRLEMARAALAECDRKLAR